MTKIKKWDAQTIEDIKNMVGIYSVDQIARILETTPQAISYRMEKHGIKYKPSMIEDRKTYRGIDVITVGGANFYWLTFETTEGKYEGYYKIGEMFNFPECNCHTLNALGTRLHEFTHGKFSRSSYWDCVTFKLKRKQKRHSANAIADELVDAYKNNLIIRQWPVGSLAHTVTF